MASEITMPQLSDTMTEGTVVKWHKKEGDAVKAGEEVADVETDKATMPMEAFDSGTLAYIAAHEGQKVNVGDLMAVIAVEGENVEEVRRAAESRRGAARQAEVRTAHEVSQAHGAAPPDIEADHPKLEEERAAARRGTGTAAPPAPPRPAEPAEHPGEARPREERAPIRASPLARRIAADKGIDLATIRGSGPSGRIVERDVLSAAETRPAPAPAKPAPSAPSRASPPAPGQTQIIPMTKMRSAISAALLRSKQTIPHYYEVIDVEMDAVNQLRQRLNELLDKENIRLSINDFIAKAVASALVRHPELNARFNAEKGEITRYADINLGFAVAIADGLIVPVLRGVHRMGLREIRTRTLDLFERARAQRLRREEQTESTFTISSLGSYGIRQFNAIINPPEVAILAVGSADQRPVVLNGQIVPRTMLTLTLSADHRVVDGAVAAEFLTTVKQLLQEPGMMLI